MALASKEFRGEIFTNVDSRIMQAMVNVNTEEIDGCVGYDSHSINAISMVQKYFKDEICATYTINGTGANMIAMKVMLDRFSSVICTYETHVNVYEAGAFEYTLGNKILTAESSLGKLTPDSIQKLLDNTKKYKFNPKVAVISQPTELGTLYTVDELKELCDFLHSKGMYLYIDGARIANALAALECDLSQMIEYPDVDAFSIGGTKAGAMFGEMVVFRRREFFDHIDYLKKQSFQHFDKSKFIGVQFETLFEKGIWLENAQTANQNARFLEETFAKKGVKSFYPVQTNMFFAVLQQNVLDRINEHFDLHYWNVEDKTVRICATAFARREQIEKLANLL